jgi:hypothetical protein
MSEKIYNIIKKYTNIQEDYILEPIFINNCNKLRIDRNSEYIYNQNGGLKYEKVIDNIKYSFDYFENKNDDNTIMFITNNENELKQKYCLSASYFKTSPEILRINIVVNPKFCLNIENKIERNDMKKKIKYGNEMIKIIINYAKDKGFKQILLEDDSKIECINNKSYEFKLEMRYVHTLTTGYPWYYNFGFRYEDKETHDNVKYNKNKLDNMKIEEIKIHKIIKKIIEIKDNSEILLYTKDTNKIINIFDIIYYITELYYNCINQKKNIYYFFNKLSKHDCIVMSLIYKSIYKDLELKYIYETQMVYNIK